MGQLDRGTAVAEDLREVAEAQRESADTSQPDEPHPPSSPESSHDASAAEAEPSRDGDSPTAETSTHDGKPSEKTEPSDAAEPSEAAEPAGAGDSARADESASEHKPAEYAKPEDTKPEDTKPEKSKPEKTKLADDTEPDGDTEPVEATASADRAEVAEDARRTDAVPAEEAGSVDGTTSTGGEADDHASDSDEPAEGDAEQGEPSRGAPTTKELQSKKAPSTRAASTKAESETAAATKAGSADADSATGDRGVVVAYAPGVGTRIGAITFSRMPFFGWLLLIGGCAGAALVSVSYFTGWLSASLEKFGVPHTETLTLQEVTSTPLSWMYIIATLVLMGSAVVMSFVPRRLRPMVRVIGFAGAGLALLSALVATIVIAGALSDTVQYLGEAVTVTYGWGLYAGYLGVLLLAVFIGGFEYLASDD